MESLLIEVGTEELPPKSLKKLCLAFSDNIAKLLTKTGVQIGDSIAYATPRRLSICIKNVAEKQNDRIDERKGPSTAHAYDEKGEPTKAATGFARSCGVDLSELSTTKSSEGEWLYHSQKIEGIALNKILPDLILEALKTLPVAKKMRWGDKKDEFVRPIQWLVILHGERLVPATVMGVNSGNVTRGHRFHGQEKIVIPNAESYEEELRVKGCVIPSFEKRKGRILDQIQRVNERLNGKIELDDDLLDEVVGLVEWPTLIMGSFDKHFLSLPDEVLISSMQKHQKYFPVRSNEDILTNDFVTVCNIESIDPDIVRLGNERVIRPRLADAEFFFQTDTSKSLESHQEYLGRMTFQKKLGTLLDKTKRITVIASEISEVCKAKQINTNRAAQLARCDLLSEMVGEFPDLQGVMGSYYAEKDGENPEVCLAIKEFYHPRFSGDTIPSTATGRCITLADKIDSIVGLFGVGLAPTGDKDFYALRRAAVGVFRIIVESNIEIDLQNLISIATNQFNKISFPDKITVDILTFIDDRMRAYYLDTGLPIDTFNSIPSLKIISPMEKDRRIKAVNEYRELPEARSLSAANKRITNILKKSVEKNRGAWNQKLLIDDSEKKLAEKISSLRPQLETLFNERKYVGYMKKLAELNDAVNNFFESVMIICDEKDIQHNRVALLHDLQDLFGKIADIGKIQL
jgi:glycyl-tRNA synthetase beta chain